MNVFTLGGETSGILDKEKKVFKTDHNSRGNVTEETLTITSQVQTQSR